MRRIAIALCLGILLTAPGEAQAQQWPNIGNGPHWPNVDDGANAQWPSVAGAAPANVFSTPQFSAVEGEFGARYFFGTGRTSKDLYGFTRATLNSRLTYDQLVQHGPEIFGRLDHTSGFFVKGFGGIGLHGSGVLIDEDFPPGTSPYSRTSSDQRDGTIGYLSIDAGFNALRTETLRLSPFAGYHFLNQNLHAYGCTQLAANPFICGGPPDNLLGISENAHWHSLRLGVEAELKLVDALSLRVEGAYLPFVRLHSQDTHHLRVGGSPGDFTGPIPEDGNGSGFQLDASLRYNWSPEIGFAVGARYWRMETKGDAHFENRVVGFVSRPQPIDFRTENYGVYFQASYKFGPYPLGVPY